MLFRHPSSNDAVQRALRAAVASHRPAALRALLASHGERVFARVLSDLSSRAIADALSMLPARDYLMVSSRLSRAARSRFALHTIGGVGIAAVSDPLDGDA